MKVVLFILFVVMAYFIGNISPSTMLAKARGLDIKKEGSGNAGTTNALRVMGAKAGVITLVVDILKGVVAVILPQLIVGDTCAMYCAVAVILGHVWPVVYKFKGGKGVATTFGAIVAINPLLGLATLGVVIVTVLITKRMSAGSVMGALLFPLLSFFLEPGFYVQGLVLAAIVIIKHRSNIDRLIHGEEPKLGFLDKDKKKVEEK
jgi:glycerol-3-phosphate acyltransferase PlsY